MDFHNKLLLIEEMCKNTGDVTISAFKLKFTDQSWIGLHSKHSILRQFLSSDHFKDKAKEQTEDQIDCDLLRLFALQHCKGKSIDKA